MSPAAESVRLSLSGKYQQARIMNQNRVSGLARVALHSHLKRSLHIYIDIPKRVSGTIPGARIVNCERENYLPGGCPVVASFSKPGSTDLKNAFWISPRMTSSVLVWGLES